MIICDLHFDRILRINYEKYDEKCYDQWYLSARIHTTTKSTELLKRSRTIIRKRPFKFN